MPGGDATSVLSAALRAFRDTGMVHMLVGATAFGVHTVPRTTLDLDFLVEDHPDRLAKLRKRFAMVEETTDPVFDQRAWIVELPTRITPLELFIASHWFTRQALSRRRLVHVEAFGGDVPVGTPEDLLLLKAAIAVHASRPAYKQATDAADVGRLLDAGLPLDLAYVRDTATKLGPDAVHWLRECGLDVG